MPKHILFLTIFAALSLSACQQTFDGAKKDFTMLRDNISGRMASLNKTEDTASAQPQRLTTATLAEGTCPPVIIEPDHKTATEFQDMTAPSAGSEISTLRLVGTQTECQVDEAGNKLNLRIDLSFNGALGPKAKRYAGDQPFFAYPYFVAVTDSNGQTLAEELFAATITYEKDQDTIETVETIRQRLPLTPDGATPAYEIHVGFQLTEEQLSYNNAVK